jgi:hypothetical protein
MAHYTVVKSDSAIYKDAVAVQGCDMSGLPEDFHALQWDGSDGHIEYSTVTKPNLIVSSKSQIESALNVALPTLITRRTTRIAEIVVEEKEAAAAQAIIDAQPR